MAFTFTIDSFIADVWYRANRDKIDKAVEELTTLVTSMIPLG